MSHAYFSPSASSRWLSCTASLALDVSHLTPKTTYASELGTALHEAGEQLLLNQTTAKKLVGATYNGIKLDRVHVTEILVPYVEFVRKHCEEGESYELFTETRAVLTDDCEGTADVVILIRKKNGLYTLKVIDLKTGSGEKVSPINNTQLMIYAAGVYKTYSLIYDIDDIQIGICQPPHNVYALVSVVEKNLVNFAKQVESVIEDVRAGNVTYVPSDSACRWCPGVSICPKLHSAVNELAKVDFKKIPKASAKTMAELVALLPLAKRAIAAIESEASERLLAGKKVPGYKLVQGRGSRDWKFSEDKLVPKLLALKIPKTWLYNSSLLSPFQIEKVLIDKGRDPKEVSKLIKSIPGKPTMAPESDSREAVDANADAQKDFSK